VGAARKRQVSIVRRMQVNEKEHVLHVAAGWVAGEDALPAPGKGASAGAPGAPAGADDSAFCEAKEGVESDAVRDDATIETTVLDASAAGAAEADEAAAGRGAETEGATAGAAEIGAAVVGDSLVLDLASGGTDTIVTPMPPLGPVPAASATPEVPGAAAPAAAPGVVPAEDGVFVDDACPAAAVAADVAARVSVAAVPTAAP
jgi:hypothetical protein